MHLVGFTMEIYYDVRPYERQTTLGFLNVRLDVFGEEQLKRPCENMNKYYKEPRRKDT